MKHEIVMYTRTRGCPYTNLALSVLRQHDLTCRTVNIDNVPEARERLLGWVGYLSVPTFIVAAPGLDIPAEAPLPLAQGSSPRGVDRGPLITEPNVQQFTTWLRRHGFVEAED